tara:strand:- start:1048 stop:1434 length:387 start_codon:yes stop_codon:yes gene_type:complete
MLTELTVGGLIFHIMSVEPQIPDTMIAPNVIMKFNEHNILLGENSVREPIVGYGYDFNIIDHANGSIDFKLGGYFQEVKPFRDRGVTLPFDEFMPIMGLEVDLPITKNVAVSTTITPLMTFTGLTFKF